MPERGSLVVPSAVEVDVDLRAGHDPHVTAVLVRVDRQPVFSSQFRAVPNVPIAESLQFVRVFRAGVTASMTSSDEAGEFAAEADLDLDLLTTGALEAMAFAGAAVSPRRDFSEFYSVDDE